MKILVVEDNADRIECFKQVFERAELSIVETSYDAIKLLKKNQYDFIFLDHDLGGRNGVDSLDANTGYQVAKQILNSPNKNTPIIVHSLNPTGANNICNLLQKNVWRIPFSTFNRSVLRKKE